MVKRKPAPSNRLAMPEPMMPSPSRAMDGEIRAWFMVASQLLNTGRGRPRDSQPGTAALLKLRCGPGSWLRAGAVRTVCAREREIKNGASTGPSFAPGMSAVSMNDALYCSQADAVAFVFAGRMKAFEGAKQFVGVFHIETSAVVPNIEDRGAPRAFLAKFDSGRVMLAGKFPGIAEQILHQHAKQSSIPMGDEPRLK